MQRVYTHCSTSDVDFRKILFSRAILHRATRDKPLNENSPAARTSKHKSNLDLGSIIHLRKLWTAMAPLFVCSPQGCKAIKPERGGSRKRKLRTSLYYIFSRLKRRRNSPMTVMASFATSPSRITAFLWSLLPSRLSFIYYLSRFFFFHLSRPEVYYFANLPARFPAVSSVNGESRWTSISS